MHTTHRELPGICRFLLILLAGAWLILPSRASGVPISAQGTPPEAAVAGAIRAPRDAQPEDHPPLPPMPCAAAGSMAGLKAVAIVGDVGADTASYRADMETAVQVLEDHGAAVSRFYYGQSSFNWAQIVAAAQGAHVMLYMGHGVYWNDQPPLVVGGFYLGNNQFVSPAQIRSDLAGVLSQDSLIIFSHACFTAGISGSDSSSVPQAEAARRVAMYAEPFVDIGMRAYFANNYNNSAAATLTAILDGKTMGDVFTSYAWFNPGDFVDLSYPEPGYDLWLDGHAPYSWNQAFVGIPGYVFSLEMPALGDLPDELAFVYSIPEQRLVPESYVLRPANVGSEAALQWAAAGDGSWFSVSPPSGTTPGTFQVAPTTFDGHAVATYTGALTVTVTSPAGVSGSPHRMDVQLAVISEPIHDLYLPAAFESWRR
jgi:hypothetical protein